MVKTRNPQAKSLMSKLFKPRVVKPKKGKGSYSRKKEPRRENINPTRPSG